MGQGSQSSSEKRKTGKSAPSLQQSAFAEACRQLSESIEGERSSASFACGGTIPITGDANSGGGGSATAASDSTRRTSPPVSIFWSTATDSNARKLVLPLSDTEESSPSVLRQLVTDCSPATFGKGNKDVLDPSYRMAGKLDPDRFSSSFHPANFGIVENIEQILLPSVSTDLENALQFRRLTADLYKLNVYSGPSGTFRKHVDTPRSSSQIGLLVVCLPCQFKGEDLIVRHNGKQVTFDWSTESASTIQWAAFYSDCEHEITTVTEGDRITLTYNLYVTEPVGGALSQPPIVEPKTLPLYGYIKELIEQPAFLQKGGGLGIFCSHAYAHTSEHADKSLPRALKGSDLVFYSVFQSLGIEVEIVPGLSIDEHETEHPLVGGRLYPYQASSMVQDEDEEDDEFVKQLWLCNRLSGITWLTKPKHREMALTHAAYGIEPSTTTYYSCAAIIAIIPPWDERARAESAD
ncbi:hypothetical protein M432DRAFT_595402 [Thermoascus aurantiacus ATCC 26904]